MGKGFASVKAKPEKPLAKSVKLNPISQIQADLSSYFTDIKDPRANRTKKHLLKDILAIAIGCGSFEVKFCHEVIGVNQR